MPTFVTSATWRDWAVPSALLTWAQLEIWVPGMTLVLGPRWLLAVAAVGAAAALTARRRHPLTSLSAVAGFVAGPMLVGWMAQSTATVLMLVVAVFACGRYALRPRAYLALPVAVLCVVIEAGPDPDQTVADAWGFSLNAVWVFALGAAFRHERFLRDQAGEVAEARVQAAQARERLRVAQDLHDVLSHSLAVVVVQAEVADAYLATNPDLSRAAVRNVAATGRSALAETRRLVGLLREDESFARATPVPGLADIPGLVERVHGAGLPVRLEMGAVPELDEKVTSTAYRVVQESLTNVLRHAGPVPTLVSVRAEPGGLVVDVTNDGTTSAPDANGDGHGLRGMRERVAACGGELTSGAGTAGGFRVRALLPLGEP